MKKIVIAGGTGFIGQYLRQKFMDQGYDVLTISRGRQHVNWEDTSSMIAALEGAALLINLAGKSVDCRYTESNRSLILSSRVDTTRKLQQAVDQCGVPPKVWVNSSTATIYRHAEDRAMGEASGEIGTGFSVDVARAWEGAFFEKGDGNTRKVALRIAIVLGRGGGALEPMIKLVRFGLGGVQGSGRQMFSWLHIEDLFRIIEYVKSNEGLQGVYNCSAPNPVSNATFMQELRGILKPPFHLSSPKLLLQAGALLINTETELILKSRWVIPKGLLEAGFVFKYPIVHEALMQILGGSKKGAPVSRTVS